MIRTAPLIALPLLLLACSGGPEDAATSVDREGTEAALTNPSIEQFDDAVVVVDANGLGPKGEEPLRFGAPRAEVDSAIEAAFGSAPERSSNDECGAGPMEFSQFGPLQIAYMDDEFRGWFLREGEGVATSDGVRPGTTTLVSLKRERQVRALDTSLEGEFEYTAADYGTITGFAEDGELVSGLQAGISCFFR